MKVQLDKVTAVVRFVNAYIGLLTDVELTDEKMNEYINYAISVSKLDVSPLELDEIKRDLTYQHQIRCTPGQSLLDDYEDTTWYTDIKDSLTDKKFWPRYKNYLEDVKHFSPNVVATLGNETLDRDIMNYLGNPKADGDFFKRGLIIGDVQSGKTSTYIGLMCKAADAGYKVFFLLTGTIESLRKQTQERVEEGFIGIDMTAESGKNRVGVGLDQKPIYATAITSRNKDFVGDDNQIAVTLESHDAIVFVIKKNASVLTKLIDWLKRLNLDPITKKIHAPMLLIDDEADNATINTSSGDDPSRINKLVRELANLFAKSNYVGFTATPYANVFIDPITTDEMENSDLFPENFIYALPVPDNYIGAKQTFSKDGKYYSQLVPICDAGEEEEDGWPFYFKHKKEWEDLLPDSLTDAIYMYYLANAIRDIKGDIKAHRSMLINISRFVKVQYYIKSQVEDIHNAAYRAVKFNLDPNNLEESLKDPIINRIYQNWNEQYSDLGIITWEDIAQTLYSSIENIQIKVVNSTSKKDKLVYTDDCPIRVIAIGGLALSRGLTLEGLIVSYFFRNTATYDVLMQMGRWFGYRKNYEELFRIWTHPDSARWYAEIADATELLKHDMGRMHDLGLKPKNFGIRVRDDCKELQITARNKMRNATEEYEFLGYSGKMVETPYLSSNFMDNRMNYTTVEQFVSANIKSGKLFEKMYGSGEHYVLQDVEKNQIIALLKQLVISKYNHEFDKEQILDYLLGETDSYISLWDVAFMDGGKKTPEYEVDICGRKIYKVRRESCSIKGDKLETGKRGRIGGPSDGKIGIVSRNGQSAEEIVQNAISNFEADYFNRVGTKFDGTKKQYPSETWFRFIKNRKPLLVIYLIDVESEVGSKAIKDYRVAMTNPSDNFVIPSVAVALGFPQNDGVSQYSKKRYKANRVYNYFEHDNNYLEIEEE